jgi:hypothetical protein
MDLAANEKAVHADFYNGKFKDVIISYARRVARCPVLDGRFRLWGSKKITLILWEKVVRVAWNCLHTCVSDFSILITWSLYSYAFTDNTQSLILIAYISQLHIFVMNFSLFLKRHSILCFRF